MKAYLGKGEESRKKCSGISVWIGVKQRVQNKKRFVIIEIRNFCTTLKKIHYHRCNQLYSLDQNDYKTLSSLKLQCQLHFAGWHRTTMIFSRIFEFIIICCDTLRGKMHILFCQPESYTCRKPENGGDAKRPSFTLNRLCFNMELFRILSSDLEIICRLVGSPIRSASIFFCFADILDLAIQLIL